MSSLRNAYDRLSPDTSTIISRYITDDGTDSGNSNMNVNGSITPVDFFIQAQPGETISIQQINVTITDSGNPAINDYGSVVGPLTNGSLFFIDIMGFRIESTFSFHRNIDFVLNSRNFNITQFSGSNRVISYQEILNDFSQGIFLDGDKNTKFGFTVKDDLSTLVDHKCIVKALSRQKTR